MMNETKKYKYAVIHREGKTTITLSNKDKHPRYYPASEDLYEDVEISTQGCLINFKGSLVNLLAVGLDWMGSSPDFSHKPDEWWETFEDDDYKTVTKTVKSFWGKKKTVTSREFVHYWATKKKRKRMSYIFSGAVEIIEEIQDETN